MKIRSNNVTPDDITSYVSVAIETDEDFEVTSIEIAKEFIRQRTNKNCKLEEKKYIDLSSYHIHTMTWLNNLSLPELVKLDLGDNNIHSLQGLRNIELFSLEELILFTNGISIISPLENIYMPHLRIIDLWDNLISDISFLYKYPGLEVLRLDHNHIEEVDLDLISKKFPALKQLWLYGNPCFSKFKKMHYKKYPFLVDEEYGGP